MPDTHINRVKQAVSGTPGTGTVTLGAAVSGFKALGSGQNSQTFACLFQDGTAWEIATGCTYTHSGPTITRGTLEDSSTGSAISLTSAATVSVVLTAAQIAALGVVGAFVAPAGAVTLTAADVGKRYNTAGTSRQFTVPSGLGDGFVGVSVWGPCTFLASGVTITDNRAAGASYAYCQLVQTAADVYIVIGVSL